MRGEHAAFLRGTPKRASVSLAFFMVSQSDLLPIMTATSYEVAVWIRKLIARLTIPHVSALVVVGDGQIGVGGLNHDIYMLRCIYEADHHLPAGRTPRTTTE